MASKNVAEIILRAKDEATKDLKGVTTGLGSVTKAAAVAAAAFVAVKGAQAIISGVASAMRQATTDALDNIEANQRLGASLAAIGRSDAKAEIEATATEIQRQGIMAGAAAEKLGAYIVNLTGAADKAPQLMRASADVAAALGVDVNTAAQQLSRTLAGDLSPRLAVLVPELRDLTKEQLLAGEAVNVVAERFKGQAREVMTAKDRVDAIIGSYGDLRARLVQATIQNENFNIALDAVNETLVDLGAQFEGNADVGDVLAKVIVTLMDVSAGFIEAGVGISEIVPQISDKFRVWWRVISIINPALLASEVIIKRVIAGFDDGGEASTEFGKQLQETARTIREQSAALSENIDANMSARQVIAQLGEGNRSIADGIIKDLIPAGTRWRDLSEEVQDSLRRELHVLNLNDRALSLLVNEYANATAQGKTTARTVRTVADALKEQGDALEGTIDVSALQGHVLRIQDIRRNAEIARIEDAEARQRAHTDWQLERLGWMLDQEMLTQSEFRIRAEQAEAEHAERITDIRLAASRDAMDAARQEHQERMRLAKIEADNKEAEAKRQRDREIASAAQNIALAQQVGATIVSQQEDTFRQVAVIIARTAAMHAAKWIAETVPPPASFVLAPAAGLLMGAAIQGLAGATFHTGGMIGQDTGIRRPGDNRLIQGQVGEAVINRQAVQRMGAGSIEAMNAGTGGGAGGGLIINLQSLDAQTIEMELREGGRLNRALRRSMQRGDV